MHLCKLRKKLPKFLGMFLVTATLCNFLLFPIPSLAAEQTESEQEALIINTAKAEELANNSQNSSIAAETLPDAPATPAKPVEKIIRESTHTLTAYTSEVAQCDSTPCITANGFNVCQHGIEDTIAANFLKFGTKVKIPELFGDRIFIVRDRMNARYDSRVDIWMVDKADAIQFGVKRAKIQVIEQS